MVPVTVLMGLFMNLCLGISACIIGEGSHQMLGFSAGGADTYPVFPVHVFEYGIAGGKLLRIGFFYFLPRHFVRVHGHSSFLELPCLKFFLPDSVNIIPYFTVCSHIFYDCVHTAIEGIMKLFLMTKEVWDGTDSD